MKTVWQCSSSSIKPLADYRFKFYDAQEKLPNIWMPTSTQLIEGDYYCRLKILGGSLRLGNPVEIEVSSIVNIPYLMYTLVGHGNIIRTERIDVPANKKSFIIRLMPSIEMIPVSYLYVYYILDGNFKFEIR
ncbi:hypothetical protein DOY81_014806 [Sarcophaga bullata]|nr:hypothetical protein DOY81_014806 [Sarcophaga bullata]